MRQAALLEGEFFFELRAYNTADIINLPYKQRFDKAAGVLRLQVQRNDPTWRMVKNLFDEGKPKFKSEAVFYQDRKPQNTWALHYFILFIILFLIKYDLLSMF